MVRVRVRVRVGVGVRDGVRDGVGVRYTPSKPMHLIPRYT